MLEYAAGPRRVSRLAIGESDLRKGLLLSSWALGRRTAPSPIVHPHPLTRRLLWDVCPYVFESFCGAFPVMRCNLSPSVFPRGVCASPSLSCWFRVVGPHLLVCLLCLVFCESPKWQAWFLFYPETVSANFSSEVSGSSLAVARSPATVPGSSPAVARFSSL